MDKFLTNEISSLPLRILFRTNSDPRHEQSQSSDPRSWSGELKKDEQPGLSNLFLNLKCP
jgi:hypothetical protein